MKTIETEGWDAVWRQDISSYRPGMILAAVEEESGSVRCGKILEYLSEHVGDLSGKRTIEIGCGGAIYSLILARLGACPTLLDYSPDALTLAKRNLDALDLEAKLMQADAFNLPSELRGQFDVAMSFGTVEHYRYPRRLAICQSHVDLVKPGGVVIISTPNVFFLPHEILKVALVARGKWFLGYEGSFSRREMRGVGRKLGLHNLDIVGSSWLADIRRYVCIVRETRTFRSWFPHLSGKNRLVDPVVQKHHWLDDLLGHDIAMLGLTRSVR